MANTASTVYLDTFNKSPLCADDRKDVATKCATKPEAKKKEEKKRQSGLRRVVKNALDGLNDAGKKIYGYDKGKPAGNSWMDDHCDGLWVKPQLNGMDKYQEDLAKFQKDFDNLKTTADYYIKNPKKVAESGFNQFVRQAADELGPDAVRDIAINKLGKDAALSLIPVGKAGTLAKIGRAIKQGVAASSYLDTGAAIAKKIQNPATLELLEDMKFLASERKDGLVNALKQWDEKPDAAMAEAMSIGAALDPCIKARKCMLVPYGANKKKNPLNPKDKGVEQGGGCCPGQTGHHLIPDTAAADAECTHQQKNAAGVPKTKKYSYGGAPTICLEGQDNTSGTHGKAHTTLAKSMKAWRGAKGDNISYADMRDKSVEAVEHATGHCNPDCLKAQLDAYYQECKDLRAVAGSSSDPKPAPKMTVPVPTR